jgi:F0F1-type ATP synthase delta subunit
MSYTTDIDILKLYEVAKSRSETVSVFENIFSLYVLHRYSDAFKVLVRHPKIEIVQRVEILMSLPCFKKSDTFQELLITMLNYRILDRVFLINEVYTKLMDQIENKVIVQVFSAQPLSLKIKDFLESNFKDLLKKDVLLYNFVQENLLAGILVKLINGKIFNFSFDKVLSDIRYQLTEAR